MATRVYNQFARQYVDLLPVNPYLETGLPDYANPFRVATDPNVRRVAEMGADYIFRPFQERTLRDITEPARMNLAQRLGADAANLTEAGLGSSSQAIARRGLVERLGQRDIDRRTDDVTFNIQTAREGEVARRIGEEVNLVNALMPNLIQERVYPDQILQQMANVPDRSPEVIRLLEEFGGVS